MQTENIAYQDGLVTLEGYCAFDESFTEKRPLVLVFHDWSGRDDFVCEKAESLAKLGYVGFAVDMYGKNKVGKTNDEKLSLMKPFIDDRTLLFHRMLAALHAAKKLNPVNPKKIAAIGFCFGGLCALDLARQQPGINGVVSFHGRLTPPPHHPTTSIEAKVLVLHGYADPLIPSEDVQAFQKEMANAHADWQMHIYGNAMHSFTNPLAHDTTLGLIYDATAAKRSWIAMQNFLNAIFA